MTALAPRLVRIRAPALGSRAEQAVRALVAVLPLATLLAAVSLAHMINMGNFPYYENDEGNLPLTGVGRGGRGPSGSLHLLV